MTLLHEVPTAKKSNIRPHKARLSSASAYADTKPMPSGLSSASANVYMAPSAQKFGGVAKNADTGMQKTRAVLKVASDHVGAAAHRFENALDKENVMRAGNTNFVRPVANHIGSFDTVKKTKKAVAPAAKCVADAAMMPITAANDNVFIPLAQSEPVQKTKDVTIKATEKAVAFSVPIAKKGAQVAMKAGEKGAHVAIELGKESAKVAVPLAKKGAHATYKASEKAVAFSVPIAKKGAHAALELGKESAKVAAPIAKKGAHAALELGKESAQLAMDLGTESFETARTMIIQAMSYDDHDENNDVEAPVAKTQMVSYAITSCEMRKMILKQELREKRREQREGAKKLQGKRSSGSLSADNDGRAEKEDREEHIVRKKTKTTAAMTARAAPADATNPNNVFVPRVIESTPAENLYEAPVAPPRMLSCHVRQESSRSLVSELTMGTVGRGGSRGAFAPITGVVADIPLVVAKRSVDEDDDEEVDRWEC